MAGKLCILLFLCRVKFVCLIHTYITDDINHPDLVKAFFEINKNNQLAGKMQAKIVEEVDITPDEVRIFFNKILAVN